VGIATAVAVGQGARKGPPDSVEFREGIVYKTVDGEELRLDLAMPTGAKGPLPIVLCVHGGGWQAGKKEDMRDAAFGLAQQGYAAVPVQYRLAPKHKSPAQFEDVKSAVEFLRGKAKEWNLDAGKVGAFGGSAGGHLVLMLATEPGMDLKGVVSLAGPTDLAAKVPDWTRGIVEELIGAKESEKPEAYKAASPLHRITKETCPIAMIHGDEDEIVPYDQSVAMRDACAKAGVEAKLFTIRGGRHGGGGTPADNKAALTGGMLFLREKLIEGAGN
jgi:acetyl esterase/lipase